MIGHKFDYDDFYEKLSSLHNIEPDDIYEEFEGKCHDSAFDGIHHHNDLCILSDGYNGEYVYVGYVLQKSKNYGSLNDYRSTDIKTESYVSDKIKEFLGFENIVCSVHAFTHYR